MKFKIGDRVKRINTNWGGIRVGDVVTVIGFKKNFLGFSLKIKEFPNLAYSSHSFIKAGKTNPNSDITIKE